MNVHKTDRLSLALGVSTVIGGVVITAHQAGWWDAPNYGVLIGLALALVALCLASLWPRRSARRTEDAGIVSPTPGAAINRLPSGDPE